MLKAYGNLRDLEIKISKSYLDFLVGIFIIAVKGKGSDFTDDKKLWYLEEVLLIIQEIWPDLTKSQYQSILNSIVDIAEIEGSGNYQRFIDRETEQE